MTRIVLVFACFILFGAAALGNARAEATDRSSRALLDSIATAASYEAQGDKEPSELLASGNYARAFETYSGLEKKAPAFARDADRVAEKFFCKSYMDFQKEDAATLARRLGQDRLKALAAKLEAGQCASK